MGVIQSKYSGKQHNKPLREKPSPTSLSNSFGEPIYFDAEFDVLVIGAGLVGSQAAAVSANDGKSVVVLEKSSNEEYRAKTPSQGSLRGLRTVQQPNSLKHAIAESLKFFKKIETEENPIVYDSESSYLMCVKDPTVSLYLKQDLEHFYSKDPSELYEEYNYEDAKRIFGINPPKKYAGIIDVQPTGATRLNIDNLIDRCHQIVRQKGAVNFSAKILDYKKLSNDEGYYLKVQYIDNHGNKQIKKYCAKQLVLAPGNNIGQTLVDLQKLHQIDSVSTLKTPNDTIVTKDNTVLEIPKIFQGNNSFAVPQRTLYMRLPRDVEKKILVQGPKDSEPKPRFGALYMLDVGKRNRLGFYMFFEKLDDPRDKTKKIWGLKIGYDPMSLIRTKNNNTDIKKLLDKQEKLIISFLNKIFDTDLFTAQNILRRDNCEYPLTLHHHPIAYKAGPENHGLIMLAGAEGYGAMAAAGAYKAVLDPRSGNKSLDFIPILPAKTWCDRFQKHSPYTMHYSTARRSLDNARRDLEKAWGVEQKGYGCRWSLCPTTGWRGTVLGTGSNSFRTFC
ncbi:MAG: FAD-dependent oxidoreductase [Pseudomonadota bacterium]